MKVREQELPENLLIFEFLLFFSNQIFSLKNTSLNLCKLQKILSHIVHFMDNAKLVDLIIQYQKLFRAQEDIYQLHLTYSCNRPKCYNSEDVFEQKHHNLAHCIHNKITQMVWTSLEVSKYNHIADWDCTAPQLPHFINLKGGWGKKKPMLNLCHMKELICITLTSTLMCHYHTSVLQ